MLSLSTPWTPLCVDVLQDVDWEFAEEAADDDLEQGASDEEGLDDDPGYRKELGEQHMTQAITATGSSPSDAGACISH